MTHFLIIHYTDYGDPELTRDQFDEIEILRDAEDIIDEAYATLEPIPYDLKTFAGLSRQCMQKDLLPHLRCLAGTRNSCICLCHTENRND